MISLYVFLEIDMTFVEGIVYRRPNGHGMPLKNENRLIGLFIKERSSVGEKKKKITSTSFKCYFGVKALCSLGAFCYFFQCLPPKGQNSYVHIPKFSLEFEKCFDFIIKHTLMCHYSYKMI